MRRSRHKLQVSTFPFLAVLLATMGALILLLLVMDRRSKVVARNRALEAHAELVAARNRKQNQHAQDEQAVRAEWERKRDALHKLLREQESELAQERNNLETKFKALSQDLGKEKQALLDLEKSILEERGRLDVKGQLLAQMRQGIAKSAQRDDQSKAEVEKLARDLAQLERALQEAKALKSQEKETFSLVPYRGKLGEGRKPVYVECTALGLIFHPEERRLDNLEFDTQVFRAEVQRRGVDLVKEKRDPSRPPLPKVSTNPYVLFLIRPDGMESYYNAVAALRAFDLDFGYEFIDAQWALNFSGETNFAGQSPARNPATSRVASVRPDLPPPLPDGFGIGPGYGSPPGSGAKGGSGFAGNGPAGSGPNKGVGSYPGYSAGGSGYPGPGYPSSGLAGGNGPRLGPLASANSANGPGSGPAGFGPMVGGNSNGPPIPGSNSSQGSYQGNPQFGPMAGGNSNGPPIPGSNSSQGSYQGNPQFGPMAGGNSNGPPIPGSNSSQGSYQGNPQFGPMAGGNSNGPPIPGSNPGQGGYQGNPQYGPGTNGNSNGPPIPGTNPGQGSYQGNPQGGPGTSGNPNNPTSPPIPGANPGQGGNQGYPQQANNQGGTPGQSGNNSSGQGSEDSQDVPWHGSPGASGQNSGSSGSGSIAQGIRGKGNGESGGEPGPMDPVARLTSRTPFDDTRPGPKKTAPSPSIGRLLANRDYLLTIECFGDVVALYPSGQVFSMANGPNQKNIDESLTRAIQQLIARRQATVRSGETPYRPLLRFQVHPEALRTYFHVYPLFENLGIPLTRENLDS